MTGLRANMMTPSQLTELISATGALGDIDERPDALSFRAPLSDGNLRAQWIALRANPPQFVERVRIDVTDADEPLDDHRVPGDQEAFQIRVIKVQADRELRLFSSDAIRTAKPADLDVENVRIADMPVDGAFATHRSRVQTWTVDLAAPFAASEPLPDPRTLASDFSDGNALPADIRPWLLRTRPQLESRAFSVWSTVSTRRLIACLSDRIGLDQGKLLYAFTGPPACKVAIPDDQLHHYFDRATAGATWVFAEGLRDSDTRHLLLANEWARTFRRHGLEELGEGSLESAKGAYRAYVKAGSKETLKALADLRKSVVDETQKISQRAQDLIGAMWKDLAVASVPFVLKVLPDAAKAENRWIGSAIASGAAAFLVFSYVMQVFINRSWFMQQTTARQVWQDELNIVLTKSEVETYSKVPIEASIQSYKWVRLWVGLFYGAITILLGWFAVANLPRTTNVSPRDAVTSKQHQVQRGRLPKSQPALPPTIPPAANLQQPATH
jgi:hypothetical protein